jgi:N-acyl-phosphatidylethanolamine-hydrolysing phospholipase D
MLDPPLLARGLRVLALSLLWIGLLGGCSYTPRYQNTSGVVVAKPFGDLIRWRWNAWQQDLPPIPAGPTPSVAPDMARIQRPSAAQVTWVGHATVLVQADGLNVLTDPIFSERASPLSFLGPRRAQPPGVALVDLPPIDVVVISHNHYDHLDRPSIEALARRSSQTLFLVPLGLKGFMEDAGARRVVELGWWHSQEERGVRFMLTPVQHWSARGLFDRFETLWGGWAMQGPGLVWTFSGDTGYHAADFRATRERLLPRRIDLALIPIGAYEPRWFMRDQHVNPDDAVNIARDLDARQALGIHWGTFELTDEALDQPPRDLADAKRRAGLGPGQFEVMAVGETRAVAVP